MRFRRSTVLVATLAVLASGCGVASRAQDADGGTAPGVGSNPPSGPVGPIPAGLEKFYEQKPDWERCGSNQQCATIEVPLDYKKPTGQTIELRARKVLAKDRGGRIGTLFINPGGPGASGQDFAAQVPMLFGSPLLRKFDIIGWDPRGVGESTPVKCLDTAQLDAMIAADGTPDTPAEVADVEKHAKAFAAACTQRAGALLSHVNTKDAARDIDVLRGIVGDSQLYYLGMSYGTYLGATYAELFPKNVGRLVLDGAVDPAITSQQMGMAQAKGFDKALDAFAEDCAQRSCKLGGSKNEVLAKVDKLIKDSDAHPLPGDGQRQVTQALVVLGMVYPLYLKEFWPRLEDAVVDGLAGNGSRLLALADEYTDRKPSGYSDNANEAQIAVNCSDRPDVTSIAQLQAEVPEYKAASPRFGEFIAWSSASCINWPVKPTDKPHPIKAAGSKPIMVLGTTRDPATPYEWAVGLAHQLENGVLVTRDGDGHTAYLSGNACVKNVVESYLVQGNTPAADIKC
ncbi:alpha/beta hydrolase [Kribbella sindirgiensis]|uniref:Alpha/beta hydrolase n=1 Tax=Kribbella sindirgiensis TaxID=1124744 RepID=A0A4R0IA38_9ACTN|nr:alpha/beta hydrolase [Kribbella sindirgiensis]TCC29893.1 alpha/beta hydrolase [Kribbella sindirgiensis]